MEAFISAGTIVETGIRIIRELGEAIGLIMLVMLVVVVLVPTKS